MINFFSKLPTQHTHKLQLIKNFLCQIQIYFANCTSATHTHMHILCNNLVCVRLCRLLRDASQDHFRPDVFFSLLKSRVSLEERYFYVFFFTHMYTHFTSIHFYERKKAIELNKKSI